MLGTAGTGGTGGGGAGSNSRIMVQQEQLILEEEVVENELTFTAGGCRWKRSCYIKYASCKFFKTTTGSPTESDDGTTKVLIFNGDGSYTA
jgi:hypothetical protein